MGSLTIRLTAQEEQQTQILQADIIKAANLCRSDRPGRAVSVKSQRLGHRGKESSLNRFAINKVCDIRSISCRFDLQCLYLLI